MLSKAQVDKFWKNGFVIAENGATVEQLNDLSVQLDEWIEQSRDYDKNYVAVGESSEIAVLNCIMFF